MKRLQLLWLWGLASKTHTYQFGDLCGRQRGLKLGFQTFIKFFETNVLNFHTNSLIEVSRETVCLSILCSTNIYNWYPHIAFHCKTLIRLPLYYLHRMSLLCYQTFFLLQCVCSPRNVTFNSDGWGVLMDFSHLWHPILMCLNQCKW